MKRYIIGVGVWLLGLLYLIHLVNQFMWDTIYSPHARSIHYDDWNPIVPLVYGWGFGAFTVGVVILMTLPAIRRWCDS